MSDIKTAPRSREASPLLPVPASAHAVRRAPPSHGAISSRAPASTALGSVAAGGLTWPLLAARADAGRGRLAPRRPSRSSPSSSHEVPTRRHQTSWRSWGGIATEADARAEAGRIQGRARRPGQEGRVPGRGPAGLRGAPGRRRRRGRGHRRRRRPARLRGRRLDGRLRRPRQDRQGPHLLLPPQVRPGLPLVRDHQPPLPPPAHRQRWPSRASTRTTSSSTARTSSSGGSGPWPACATPWAPRSWPSAGRTPGPSRPASCPSSSSTSGSSTSSPCPTTTWAGSSARPAPTPRPCAAPRARADAYLRQAGTTLETERPVRRERPPPRRGLPGPAEGGRLPGPDHQRLHGHDHAPGRDLGLPDPEHAQRRRLPGLLRIRLRRHPVRRPAGQHRRPAGLPQRPDLPPRRHHHPGPLHGAAEDGRPDASSRPAS
ncbi:MAG: hypothetical protein MZV64_18210 [Ignavibacteriales bacterium]|nr:hypothetical protein [Ignavibacteriales bacterium]